MAKIKGLENPKPKTSLFLCCFGSLHRKTPLNSRITESEHTLKQKNRSSSSWFPWKRIPLRKKNYSMTKTVPLECSDSDETEKLQKLKFRVKTNKVQSTGWKSKSNLLTNQTTSKSPQNGGNNVEDDTRQQSRSSSPTRCDAIPLPASKRQVRLLQSSMHSQTTSRHAKHRQPQSARRYDHVIPASVIIVILVSMILWGRLCSILCTTAWLCLIPRLRMAVENHK